LELNSIEELVIQSFNVRVPIFGCLGIFQLSSKRRGVSLAVEPLRGILIGGQHRENPLGDLHILVTAVESIEIIGPICNGEISDVRNVITQTMRKALHQLGVDLTE